MEIRICEFLFVDSQQDSLFVDVLWGDERADVNFHRLASGVFNRNYPGNFANSRQPVRCRIKCYLQSGFAVRVHNGFYGRDKTMPGHAEWPDFLAAVFQGRRSAHAGSVNLGYSQGSRSSVLQRKAVSNFSRRHGNIAEIITRLLCRQNSASQGRQIRAAPAAVFLAAREPNQTADYRNAYRKQN